jgi:transposase
VLHAGLDLSRKRVDVCLISDRGELIGQFAVPADRDGLHGLARRVAASDRPVRGVVESMNGARFVHDELAALGWEVLIADAQRVKGLAPLACKTDKIDARVLAELKNRVHSTLIAFGYQVPMADLFGLGGRRLLAGLDIPQPVARPRRRQLELIDDLELRISRIEAKLKRSGADHRYVPLLLTAPAFGWITSFTVACEIGDIGRFSSPVKLTGYTGLCPRVKQSGEMDRRGPLSKHGPRYLRWG